MVSGPSNSAFVSPMRIGLSRTDPTISVPMRAMNDSAGSCETPSRIRYAVLA